MTRPDAQRGNREHEATPRGDPMRPSRNPGARSPLVSEYRDGLPPRPRRIEKLPLNERGYPVPWFVAWIDGKPDFRVIAPGRRELAFKEQLCWTCGERLGAHRAYVIGPMCAVNRVSSEPPSHDDCANYSAKACPFLANPKMHRREENLPADRHDPPGIAIDRNPGVALVWYTSKPTAVFRTPDGGFLFDVGEPDHVGWYCQGRPATREEVENSIRSGIPILQEMAEKEGVAAVEELSRRAMAARELYPVA